MRKFGGRKQKTTATRVDKKASGKNKEQSEDSLDQLERQLQGEEEDVRIPNKRQSSETMKMRKAKQFIQQMRAKAKVDLEADDFFMQNQNNQQNVKIDTLLREEYLKGTKSYYQKTGTKYSDMEMGQPEIYKGHTKCITAVEWGPNKDNFFSCSKDGSIIKWDTQTKKKQFISFGKEDNHHKGEILCMSLNHNGTLLVTGSTDSTIKLWDAVECKLIQTFKSHKGDVNGVKFGHNEQTFCSVGEDRTFKVWDGAERTYIDTFFGHREQVLDIDCVNGHDFISSGSDSQVIIWKTQKETQAVYNGHDFSIDRVRAVHRDYFITASQDSDVFLWNNKRKRPIFKCHRPHGNNWVTALGTVAQSDIFVTGSSNNLLNIFQISPDMKKFQKIREVQSEGIVNDIKLRDQAMLVVEGDEHRLGRWITKKSKNQIKLFTFRQ